MAPDNCISNLDPSQRESREPEIPVAASTAARTAPAPLSAHITTDGDVIDFHAPEFNNPDDLNDFSGNCRSFQTLDGIVTADMRHQIERSRSGETDHPDPDNSVSASKNALESERTRSGEDAATLSVISQGRTLIIGPDAENAIACGKLLQEKGLTCTILVTNDSAAGTSLLQRIGFGVREVHSVSVSGAFGGFSAMITAKEKQENLALLPKEEPVVFDLILDLQTVPSYAGDCLPTGYYAPSPDQASIDRAMQELPEMKGQFSKPQFTAFRKDQCIYGRSRTNECRQCLTVCPVGAIQSAGREISIDHYICQGCGGCALVCPADAIRMIHPSREELLGRLKSTLESRSPADERLPTLVISGAETSVANNPAAAPELNNGCNVYFPVEQIGHVGLDMLLAALAYGAGSIVVLCSEEDPPNIKKAVEWQTKMAGAILQGMGLPRETIRFVEVSPEIGAGFQSAFISPILNAGTNGSVLQQPSFSPHQDKRLLTRMAAQHLYDRSGVRDPDISMPIGSPFGAVAVDSAACTLCMACAVGCHASALIAAGAAPRLEFLEARCHQCGLCKETCPEGAIQLSPRMLCDPQTINKPVPLHEAAPFNCVECGMPFTTQTMIDHMRKKLSGHWMYANEKQIRRLSLCAACRTKDALVSEDWRSWNH